MGEVCCWQNVHRKQTAKCSWEAEVSLLRTGQVSVVLSDHQLTSDFPAGKLAVQQATDYRLGAPPGICSQRPHSNPGKIGASSQFLLHSLWVWKGTEGSGEEVALCW